MGATESGFHSLTCHVQLVEIELLQLWKLLADCVNDVQWQLLAATNVKRLQRELKNTLG